MVTCPRLRWKKNRGISEGSLLEREMPLGSWLIRMRSSIHEARTAVSFAPSTHDDCAWVYRWLSKRTGGPILGYRWQTPALAAQLASMQGGHRRMPLTLRQCRAMTAFMPLRRQQGAKIGHREASTSRLTNAACGQALSWSAPGARQRRSVSP